MQGTEKRECSRHATLEFTNVNSLKIHLHRWIIIKACYYIRNMKLKRPSGANDYDTLADIEGEGGVSTVSHVQVT
jgi:hypothetical protein